MVNADGAKLERIAPIGGLLFMQHTLLSQKWTCVCLPFRNFCCVCLHALAFVTDTALCLGALKEAFRTFAEWAAKNEMSIWAQEMRKRDIISISLSYAGLRTLK